MPGRLQANGISGCLSFLTARSAEAENRQIFQDAGKYFLEHHFPQAVPVTRGQGQSPALEGDAHANFRVTPRTQEADAFEKADALNPPCATSPGSGGLPFKGCEGRERRAPTPPLRQAHAPPRRAPLPLFGRKPPPCGGPPTSRITRLAVRGRVTGSPRKTKPRSQRTPGHIPQGREKSNDINGRRGRLQAGRCGPSAYRVPPRLRVSGLR